MFSSSIGTTISKWLIDHGLTDSFDPRVSFAELGLDSINAVQLAVFLEQELRMELDQTIVYTYPTVETLAQHLVERFAAMDDEHMAGNAAPAVQTIRRSPS